MLYLVYQKELKGATNHVQEIHRKPQGLPSGVPQGLHQDFPYLRSNVSGEPSCKRHLLDDDFGLGNLKIPLDKFNKL